VTLYRESTGTFESDDDLPDGTAGRSLWDAAGTGETTLTTANSGLTSATFDFPVREELDLAGVRELSLRVTLADGDVVLSAALARVDGAGSRTVLKDRVAVQQVDRPGVVRLDLIGIEATLQPGETLRLLVGIDDGDLAPGLTLDALYSADGAGLPSSGNYAACSGRSCPTKSPRRTACISTRRPTRRRA
jgi:predicted acyl esterase